MRAAAALAVLSLTASGCWLQRGFGPTRDRFVDGDAPITPANADQLVQLWRTTGLGATPSEPVAIGDNIYLTVASRLLRLSAGTGAVQYDRPLTDADGAGLGTLSSPIYHDGEVLVGWQRLRQSGADLMTVGGRARLVPATGEPIEPVVPNEFGLFTEDMAAETGQLVPQESGKALLQGVAFRAFAQVTWRDIRATFGLQTVPANYGPSSFAIAGDHLAWANVATALGWNGNTCTNPDPADQLPGLPPACLPDWQTTLPANAGGAAAVGTDAVAYSLGTNQIDVLDAATGAVLFTGTVPGSPSGPLSAPAVAGDTILVTTSDGRVAAFPASGCGAADCAPVWLSTIGTTGGPAPTVVGDVVYAATSSTIVTLDLGGCGGAVVCPRIATYNVGETIGAVAYDAGRLLVTTRSGSVAAFGLPPAA